MRSRLRAHDPASGNRRCFSCVERLSMLAALVLLACRPSTLSAGIGRSTAAFIWRTIGERSQSCLLYVRSNHLGRGSLPSPTAILNRSSSWSMIAFFCWSLIVGQAAISATDRPQPTHHRPLSSSLQTLTQGDATLSVMRFANLSRRCFGHRSGSPDQHHKHGQKGVKCGVTFWCCSRRACSKRRPHLTRHSKFWNSAFEDGEAAEKNG